MLAGLWSATAFSAAVAQAQTERVAAGGDEEWFVDVSAEAGLAFRHRSGATGDFLFPEIMGAGVALFDSDGDGDLDVYLVQGGALAPRAGVTQPDEGSLAASDRLFRNELASLEDRTADGPARALRFTDVTREAGLLESAYGMGVAAGDYDHDGSIDLYVANFGPDRLLRNRGDGTFEDATARAGIGEVARWSVSASFADVDRDGWLDLFVAHYVDATLSNHRRCRAAAGYRDYCGPLAYRPVPSRLLRNQRDGTFRDVTAEAGLDAAYGGALGVAAADLDGDGWLDLYVANDQTANQLWRNQGDGTFLDEALLAGVALDVNGQPQASMGVDVADFDGDGDEDVFLTHLAGETDTLYVNDGAGLFHDGTVAAGLAPAGLAHTGFGTAWIDADNDGWLDLLMVNGAVTIVEALRARADPHPFHQPDQLLRNLGAGRFADVSTQAGAALLLPHASRGAAFGDLDQDGDTDVVVSSNDGPAVLLRNEKGSRRAWLGLRLIGREAGAPAARDQLGARVELARGEEVQGGAAVGALDGPSRLVRRARAEGSYASANDPRILIGLGRPPDAASERVRVTWPDGSIESFDGLAAGRYHTLRRGDGEPRDATADEGAAGARASGAEGARASAAAALPRDAPRPSSPDRATAPAAGDVAPLGTGPGSTLPRLELSGFDPAAAAQISAARDAVARLAADVPPAARAEAIGDLGRVCHAYQLLDAAVASYRAAAAIDPAGGRWAYLLGVVEQSRGRPDQAIAALERSLAHDPASIAAWLRLADQELDLGRTAAARAAYDRARAIDPDEAAALYGLGRAAHAEGDSAAARRFYERALELQPDASLVHYALGQACRALGDHEAARRHLARAGQVPVRFSDEAMARVESMARGASAHLAAGARAHAVGDWDEAIRQHRAAVAAAPDDVEARLGLAFALLAAGDAGDEAAEALRRAARLAPDRADVRHAIGVRLAALGDAKEGEEQVRRAIELDPGHVEARLWLGDWSARRGDLAAALAHYDAALAREPARNEIAVKRATALYLGGRHRDARAALEAVLGRTPRDPLARAALARLLASAPDEALREPERAVSLARDLLAESQTVEHAELLAMAHAAAGRFAEAIVWQERALDAAAAAGAGELATTLERNLDRYRRGESCCG